MKKLIDQIKSIPKIFFTLNDLRKVSGLKEGSLKVAVHRLVKSGRLIKLSQGLYALDVSKVDFEKIAVEIYAPSYISFEWALASYGILSQQPVHLTLATTKRAKVMKIWKRNIIYHHLQPKLFWGYENDRGVLTAKPEKAFLDLAYLSLNGYAKFDAEEIDLGKLDKMELKRFLKKFNSKRLEKLVKEVIGL